MVIRILEISGAADTTVQGLQVQSHLKKAFARADQVTLSFDGISTATSSFINASLVPLLDGLTISDLKKRLKIVQSTRQINEMIRRCLDNQASRALAVA